MEAGEVLTPELGTHPVFVTIGISRATVSRHREKRSGSQPEPQKRFSPPPALIIGASGKFGCPPLEAFSTHFNIVI
jgi:hypothetical protein